MKLDHFKQLFLSAATALLTFNTLWAVPAKPGLVTVTQDDGTELTVRLIGDEHGHIVVSEDGNLLTASGNTYYYATLDADGKPLNSGIRATNVNDRTDEARRFLAGTDRDRNVRRALSSLDSRRETALKTPARVPSTMLTNNFPSTGKQKAIVVLVEYKDVKFRLDDPHDYFDRMLNEEGFSSYGGTGCAREYFIECSNGQFEPEFDLYGPITLKNNMAYYGGNNYSGSDSNPEQMAIEACQQLDELVDFAEYDRDGDGMIDNVFVIYAGKGEASGGSASSVWPHAWNVFSGAGLTHYFDGKLLDYYACSNEWEGNKPDGVGTFIHEFSHVMGLPDLYVTTYANDNFTPREWSVLDVGPYNNDGRTPPLYSAFERMSMGWMKPRPLTGPGSVALLPVSSNTAYYIPTLRSNEFFLLENRQQESWDTYIPGHGMLVWHVDYNTSAWGSNSVNNTDGHPRVEIEAADGIKTLPEGMVTTSPSDPFPGTALKTEFTDTTNPSMLSWDGRGQNLPLTSITETEEGLITFDIAGGAVFPLAIPVALEAENVAGSRFTARWEAVEGATGYIVVIDTDGAAVPVYHETGNTTTLDVTGLMPETAYRYRVAAYSDGNSTVYSNPIEVTTSQPSLGDISITANEATDITGTSFVANWTRHPLATDYLLTVSEYIPPTAYDLTHSLATRLPEGWESDCDTHDATTSLEGILLDKDGAYLSTGVIEAGVSAFSFKHYGVGSAAMSNTISIWALDGDAWIKIGNTYPNIATVTYTVRGIPDNCKGIKIVYTMTKNAPVLIGEISIKGGSDTDYVIPLESYQGAPTGDVESFTVTGLRPEATYMYTVTGTDGDLRSAASNRVYVVTSAQSSIGSIAADDRVKVVTVSDGIVVSGTSPVSVYNLQGQTIYAGQPGHITLAPGLYIVRSASSAVKVAVTL